MQTGGLPLGWISTKSNSRRSAISIASLIGYIPCSILTPTTLTTGAFMRSLTLYGSTFSLLLNPLGSLGLLTGVAIFPPFLKLNSNYVNLFDFLFPHCFFDLSINKFCECINSITTLISITLSSDRNSILCFFFFSDNEDIWDFL